MVELFEYKKNNQKYLDGPKLYKQVVNKTFSIAKAFYLGYLSLFLFDNAISYFVYTDNMLYIIRINKKNGEKLSNR